MVPKGQDVPKGKQVGKQESIFLLDKSKKRDKTLQNGVDIKTGSEMLGHYDAGFTLRTYTHTTAHQQKQAADMMGSLVARSL